MLSWRVCKMVRYSYCINPSSFALTSAPVHHFTDCTEQASASASAIVNVAQPTEIVTVIHWNITIFIGKYMSQLTVIFFVYDEMTIE